MVLEGKSLGKIFGIKIWLNLYFFSAPIHCQTDQDTPEAPTAVKALIMSSDAILVSWRPPAYPNGNISKSFNLKKKIVEFFN